MVEQSKESRPCERCKGLKVNVRETFTALDGTEYPKRTYKCNSCNGLGTFEAPDLQAIETAITTKRGSKDGTARIRKQMTSSKGYNDMFAGRAYYVWRMAVFHGADSSEFHGAQCMPVMADIMVSGDPFKKELDAFADEMAKRYFGTNMQAANRWARALGYVK